MFKRFGIALISLFCFASVSKALVYEYVPAESVTVNYNLSVAADITTATVIIDRDDTTNWPHEKNEQLNIDSIKLSVDGVAFSTVTIKFGVVTQADDTNSDIRWFHTYRKELNISSSTTSEGLNWNPAPSFIRLKVIAASGGAEGSTPYLLTNDVDENSTTFQTDLNLPSPNGNTAPEFADVVMQVSNGTSEVRIDIQVIYHARNN